MLSMSTLQIKLTQDGQTILNKQDTQWLFLSLIINKQQRIDGKGVKKQQDKFNFYQKKFCQMQTNTQKINIQFEIRSINKKLFGLCQSFLVKGYNRFHCMDLIDRNKKIIGGMIYQAIWTDMSINSGFNSGFNKRDIIQQRKNKYSDNEQQSQDDGFFGIFSCCSIKRKDIIEPKKLKMVPANELIIYDQNQLDNIGLKNNTALFVQYYSKTKNK